VPRALAFLVLLLLHPLGAIHAQGTDASGPGPIVGPASGTLIAAGGGPLGPEIWGRFVELAGGADARIVVIPTAGEEDVFSADGSALEALRAAGAKDITVIHTRDPVEADTEFFVSPLREATGVWIPGGRQHRLVDAYMGTRVHEELFRLLERNGVIGGSSAGASIQASFLVRGDPATNQVVMSPEYLDGFGFLESTAVDQHLLTRNRGEDLWVILDLFPHLLGIGLDESTALVIQGDRAEVIGTSQVVIYDASGSIHETRILQSGDVFDLGRRSPFTAGVLQGSESGDVLPR